MNLYEIKKMLHRSITGGNIFIIDTQKRPICNFM